MDEQAIKDLMQRLNNVLRPGTIAEADHLLGRAKIRLGPQLKTTWLQCFEACAGNPRTSTPLKIGEQVMVLSPGGELSSGFALRGLSSAANPRPSDSETLHLCKYDDGLELSYDTASNSLVISRPEKLNVLIKATKVEFETEKFEVRNKAGIALIKSIFELLKMIIDSTTVTMMGDNPLLPASVDGQAKAENIKSFGG
jgi:phage baseplate assembly protein V